MKVNRELSLLFRTRGIRIPVRQQYQQLESAVMVLAACIGIATCILTAAVLEVVR